MAKFIALTGYDDCGKDFIASAIKEQLEEKGYKVKIKSFADPLKDVCCKLIGVSRYVLDRMKKDDKILYLGIETLTTRDFIIRVADTEKEIHGNDIYIKRMLKDTDEYDFIIVPDLRFRKEAEFIDDQDGLIFKVNSDIPACGKNGKRYEVDKIEVDGNIRNIYKAKELVKYKEVKIVVRYIEEDFKREQPKEV
jgi:hypothetical protein